MNSISKTKTPRCPKENHPSSQLSELKPMPKATDLKKEWNDIFKTMDKKELKLSENEIQKEINVSRKKKIRQ